MSDFIPHSPEQNRALFFSTPIGLLACGIQFGKTKVGSMWMKMQHHRFIDPADNFLIVAPTYKILTQSTLPPYLDVMQDYGSFSKADMTLKIHGGGTCYIRSATDPESIVGITNIRAIWGDEAGLFTLYFSENIAARAAFKNAQTLYTTSPYSLNWMFKQIILPKMRDEKARPDVTLIQAASWQNPYFPKEVIERNRASMDARRFNALFGGIWDRMAGLVYDCYSQVENKITPFGLPTGTRFFGGIDWGYTDPFVLVVLAITPRGTRYLISETYQTGLTITDIVQVCRQRKAILNIEMFYCGPDQPASIEELNRNKIPAMPADNDIRMGVDYVYEQLKTRQLKIFEGLAPHLEDEIETYHYPEPSDLKPDQHGKEQNPVGQNDHVMDALRYVAIMTKNANSQRKAPHSPEEVKPKDEYAKLKHIFKPKSSGRQTEDWD